MMVFFLGTKGMAQTKNATVLSKKILESSVIVDVRTKEEFQASHVKNAINIPLSEIETRLPELAKKKKTIVVYCRSGNRSGQAMKKLEKAGIPVVNGINQSTLEKIK